MTEKLLDTFTSKVKKAEIAVVMPIHNEAETIEQSVTEFYDVVNPKMPLEIVLSEDGSTDDTENVIEELSEKIPLKAVLSTSRKGYAGGIKDGLKLVTANYVLITDSDGQHDPTDFWKIWNLRGEYDIVSGWRKKRADSLYRRIMSQVFQLRIRRAFNLPNFKDITAPFKLMKTEVAIQIAEECKYMSESFWNEFTVRAHVSGFSIGETPVSHRIRADKSATRVYKPWKIPKIALAQLMALSKLKSELNM
ncbi:glycosyltransferase family 2 protein [Candidatus Bathyarchaeota archaeon]|nr:glycosyltransferase family 2 protein [Candidatus Bathyarchaeota archaeon]